MSDRNTTDEQLVREVRAVLDHTTDHLGDDIGLRLRRARLEALEHAGERRSWFGTMRWLTAGGVAMVAMVAVAGSFWLGAAKHQLPLRQPEEVEILTARENLELYQDLEFYKWLADDPDEEDMDQ